MAEKKIPYVTASGNVKRVLEKIQPAVTPERFTQDFLATKLGMSGGSSRPVLPFLKRTGFLASDGTPTDRYKRFRAERTRGAAAAEALREGYEPLYEINEYAHELEDSDLRDLVIQVTGSDGGSSTVTAIVGSFRALQSFADFDRLASSTSSSSEDDDVADDGEGQGAADPGAASISSSVGGLSLGYTINLHLPSTTDIAVFNAIFKSLKDNLLQ